MKIVIVLCSIATFAIAVPVHQEKFIESSLTNQLVRKRESISPLPGTSGLPPEDGIEKSPIDSSKKSGQGISVEAKGFKRPIIIKRKFAYHVYRDSDEEMAHAEPGERCREQVKFKLCDHEPVLISKNGINTPTFKCVADHKTDNVMKNSIKMTKEAVEHLQRDLKRMENFSPKMVSSQIEDIESNFGLYHDIEIAREAIEHIEQNFKSVNSEVNKFNELQIPKSQGEERLNRWREAIDNIHKNFEIMKNIEDGFKSDNLYSTIQPNARKANQPEAVEHSFHDKFINDNLDNKDDDVKLKSASNKVRLAQPTLKSDNLVNIGKDAENDIFISSSDNREENKQLHSDSLKSEISSKDASLRSDGSKMESEKQSTEFSAKNSNTFFEVPKYSEHEKTTNDHISDEYELLPKVSSSSLYSLHENEKNEEKKTLDKSQLMMKTALQEKENRKPIIKMKTVKEILENGKDQLKTATSNEENINNYEEMFFKSNNKNSPLEELSAVPMSRIAEASGNLEYGSEEKKYSDKEQQPIVFNTNMRLSNDQLEKVKSFPVDSLVTKDQYVTESSHVFPLNAKNAFSGEDNGQNEHKNIQIIKENQVFNYPQDSEIEDEVQKLKNVLESNDEYKSIKSSDGHDKQESLRKIQNKELKNDDSLVTVVKTETEFYKTVSDADNEDILNDREQSSHQHIKEQMPLSVYQSKDANQDPKWLLLKSVPELPSELTESLPTDRVEVTDDQQLYKEKASMTSSENQKEKIQSNENQEMQEHLPMRLDNKRHPGERLWQSPKSVDELLYDPTVSISRNTDDITDDKQSYKEEASMRSSEKQFENMELDENQKVHVPLQTSIYIKNAPEGHTWQFSKSVPELNSDLMVSMPTDTVDITNDQHSIKEDPSMRSSQIQNDLLQLNGNQEFSDPSPPRLNSESYQEEHISQFLKSVPELQSHRTESLHYKDEVDVTDDQQSYREKASMGSLENQNENMQSNENRAMQEHLPTRLDNERHSEERSWQSPKSVDEVIYDPTVSISRNTDDITDDKQSYKEEASLRSSGNLNENMHSNENREMQEHLPTRLDNERHSEERSWQSPKSVDEVIYDPTVSISRNTDDITDDKQSYKEEASLRSSANQNENMHSNENRKMQEYLPTRLDNERHSEERSWQSPKSVDELIYDPKVSISRNTDDKQPHKEEASLRSSEYQNENMHSNENREMQEHLPTRLDNERHSEERSWQSPKSVDEVIYDPTVSISRNTDDITDDKQSYKEEASLRSSGNQNENMQSNENRAMQEHLPTRLDNERHSEERSWQSPKSVDEVIYDPTVSISRNTDDITDDKQSYKEEASLRSSGNQNENMQSNENRAMQEHLPTRLDNERHSEERSWQSPKSVDEVIYDPTVSISRNTDDITDDKQSYKEEASLRSSGNQNENMQSNENRAMQEHLPTRLDNERHSEERSWQSPKSVDEVIYDPTVSISRNTDDITDDKQSYKEEASLRSSGNQNENMQSNENRAMQEHLPTRLDNERHSEERSWQSPKSVDEVIYDPTVSISRNTDDITDDKQSYKEEASLRSSENQNENMHSNENLEMQEHLPTRLDNERHSEERSWQSPKSVDEVIYDPTVSISRNTDDITDDKQSYKEEASLRSSENQNENMHSNENREMQEHLPTRLDNERHSEERSWQSPKSVDEVIYDPTVSISRNTDDITDDKQSYKEEASLRSSGNQNENMHSNENRKMQEYLPTRLDNERHSEERSWQSPKSVDEVIYDPTVSISRNTDDVMDDKQSHKEEASLRSSEYQNEHMQSNENRAMQEHLPTRLDNERHSEERSWQSPKSVDEVIYDPTVSISRNTDDNTDDKQSYKEEASLRSSENQNENMHSNENREMQEHLPTRLDNERHSEERSWQSPKSVDEVIYDPTVSISRNTDDITDDKQSYKEEASLRSSENQNELPISLDNDRHLEERLWQSPKSVDELSYDAKVPSNFAKMTDNQNSHKEIATARASDKQFDKMQSNENLEAHEALPMGWDIETRPEKGYWQSPKFVDELSYDPMKSMPTKTADVTENQYSDTGDASIRLSENQNKKLAARLSIENNPEDRTGQYSKAVSEPTSDRIALKTTDIVDVTDNQHLVKGEGSMRLSQSQNEKLQLNEYQEEPKSAATNFDIENSSEDKTTSQLSISASESQSDQTKVLFKDTVDITDDQHSREASMRSSENKYENIQPTEGQETHETLPTRFNIENHPEDQTWQMLKSVPESTSDSMGSMPTDKSKITKEQQSINEGNMRLSQDQNYKWLLNEYEEGPKYAETRLENEKSSEDTTSQLSKSAFESQSDQTKLLNMDTVDITKDQNSHETSMRSSENKYDKIQPTDSQEIRAALPTRLNIENHPEDQTWQMAKSVPESSSNSMLSTATDNVEITKEQHFLNEGNMRIPQNQNEKLQLNEYEEESKYTATRLENEKSSEDTTSEFSKSASESPSDQTKVWITDTVDITNDQHSLEASMRSSEMKYENIQPTESQEIHETLPTRFNIENNPEDQTWQMSKSVPESTSDSMVSMPTDNFEITKEQHSINEGNMRLSQNQNDKWLLNEYEKEPKYAETRLENEKSSEDTTSQLSKSASETQSDQTKLFNTDTVDITNDQNSHEANMRSSENKYDKIQPTDSQEIHAALPTRLNIENYQMSKSVPEPTSDPMVSMPTESFNMRVSQNQYDRSRFDEINSEHSGTSQFFKSAPESYMTPTDLNHVNNKNTIFKEEARLSQNPNEEQHINLNHYLYDPLWAISNGEKSLGDDSSQIFKSVSNEHVLPIAEHKEKFSFTQDPINDQTYMRFSQNQNEKNEIQYPRMSLGFSNLGYINKEDNTNVLHDDLRVAHPQQLYENSDPILQSSNDRQHLSENFQTLSEYKMLSPKSQLKYSNGQNAFNEHLNMGINQQQSRDPQSVENHNFHNLLSMRWNTENQHRDPSPKTFQPNTGFDHTLHRGKQFDYDHTRPELYGDRVLDNTQSRQWFKAKQHNDNFLNYYKTIPEAQEEYLNPYYNQNLHRVPLYHGLNDGDTFSSSDFPSSSARLHDHMQKYHQEKASNVDSPIQPSMHMNMREPFAISGTEVNNEHFNHPHGTARFGTALPIGGIGSGAMGVFPTANAGCGIPLLLSCNPSVISGSLARSHIGIPGFKSVDENYKYYMKRNAKNIEDVPDIDVQKASAPHNHDKDAVTGI